MSSGIPLPALDVRTPQQQDPMQEYAKLVGLKSALQQQQTQQQLAPLQVQQAQQQTQAGALQLGQTQAMNKAYQDALSIDPNTGSASIDQDKLSKSLAESGHGSAIPTILKNTADYQKSFADAQKAQADVKSSMDDAMGSVAATIKAANYDPNMADLLLQHQLSTPNLPQGYKQQLMQVDQQIKQNPALVKSITDQLLAASPKQTELATAQTTAQARQTAAQTGAAEFQAKMPGGQLYAPTIAAQTEQATTPYKIQQAVGEAQATLPVKAATAAAEEQARVPAQVSAEVQKAQALAPSLENATKTMMSGQKYLDLTNLKGPEAAILTQQAMQAGIPVADAKTSTALSAIDTARQNQQFMLDQISSKLASGAPSRLWYGPANTIEKIAQSDPTLAAIGDYRSAAIQSMRAVAGSGGLRINQAEIKQATDNDIPKMTDTLPVAQQKLKNMQAFLDSTERGMLVQNRGQNAPQSQQSTPQFKAPSDAPSAQGLSDGHKLRDKTGNVIAISKGGQWQAPTPTQ